jgi:hypothetical protein
MARTKQGQPERVFGIMRLALKNLLELGVKYRLHKYIIGLRHRDWRGLELELHSDNYPVKGIGIIATRDQFDIHESEDVSPEDISTYTNTIPFDAAMAAYAFTILESCGDEVVSIVIPAFSKDRSAWHRLIPAHVQSLPTGALAISDALAISEKFSEPFGLLPNRNYVPAVEKMAALKMARNKFAHRGDDVEFEGFYRNILFVAVRVYFANLPAEQELKLFPFAPLDPKWK